MNSHLPKPALQRVIHKMDCINIEKIYIVFGQKGEQIKNFVFKTKQLEYAETIMHKFI